MFLKISFEEIKTFWLSGLWPDRDDIKPISTIKFSQNRELEYDMNIKNSIPTFWGCYHNDQIIGCVSGFSSCKEGYRVRGLYVTPEFRGFNISKVLLELTIVQAKLENKKFVWSIPRKDALYSYKSVGFLQCSDWFDKGMLYGPNCFVKRNFNE